MGSQMGDQYRRDRTDAEVVITVADTVSNKCWRVGAGVDGESGRVCSDDRICLPGRLLGATTASAKAVGDIFLHVPKCGSSSTNSRCSCVMLLFSFVAATQSKQQPGLPFPPDSNVTLHDFESPSPANLFPTISSFFFPRPQPFFETLILSTETTRLQVTNLSRCRSRTRHSIRSLRSTRRYVSTCHNIHWSERDDVSCDGCTTLCLISMRLRLTPDCI